MKWKSNEFVADGLKWRDIVSFAGHPLQAGSRVVSKCLQMLVNHLIDQGTGLAFAKMQGVRDQIHAVVCMGGNPQSLSLKEEDVTDMFWEIPSTEVKSALSWALSEVGKSSRSKSLSFSVSKESKALDRLGKASTKGFVIVSQDALERFVSFDLFDNILFIAGAVILQQNGKGVPIGGFISAPAAELWAMWKEARSTSEESRSALTSKRNAVLGKPPRDWAELQPPQPLLPVSATLMRATDFTMPPQVAATMTQHGALMTHASPILFSSRYCMRGVSRDGGSQWTVFWVPCPSWALMSSLWRPIPGTALLKGACILLLNIHRSGIGEKWVSSSSVLIHYKG